MSQLNFLVWKNTISPPEKEEEKKNSSFQKYSQSFWCVICDVIVFLPTLLHLYVFPLPTEHRRILGVRLVCEQRAILPDVCGDC